MAVRRRSSRERGLQNRDGDEIEIWISDLLMRLYTWCGAGIFYLSTFHGWMGIYPDSYCFSSGWNI